MSPINEYDGRHYDCLVCGDPDHWPDSCPKPLEAVHAADLSEVRALSYYDGPRSLVARCGPRYLFAEGDPEEGASWWAWRVSRRMADELARLAETDLRGLHRLERVVRTPDACIARISFTNRESE